MRGTTLKWFNVFRFDFLLVWELMLLRINGVRPVINFAIYNKTFTPSSLTLDVRRVNLLLFYMWTDRQVCAWSWSMRYSIAMICVYVPILL